jgi:hypothetical protein
MASFLDAFDDKSFDSASPLERGDKLPEGLHVVQIRTQKVGKSTNAARKTDGWPLFSSEFTVLYTTSGDTPEGSTRSWVQLVNNGTNDSSKKEAQMHVGNIKAHIAACVGRGVSDIKREHIQKVENNPRELEGRKLIVEVGATKKSKGGFDFNPTSFRPWSQVEEDRIKGAKKSSPTATASAPSTTSTTTVAADDVAW